LHGPSERIERQEGEPVFDNRTVIFP
jgi:hypothetical protein